MGNYENPFEFDFDSYIRQVEPSKQEKGKYKNDSCFYNKISLFVGIWS